MELDEAIELPAEEIVSFLKDCLSPDVLIVDPDMEKGQISEPSERQLRRVEWKLVMLQVYRFLTK